MTKILIILSSPRSFSSIVSTMVGQHPQMYGFPELNLFTAETIADFLKYHERLKKILYLDGLIRTLAQLNSGSQSSITVLEARTWLAERQDWTTQKLCDYLLEKINPKIELKIQNLQL